MKILIHPTHARTTRVAMIVCLAITVVALVAAFFVDFAASQILLAVAMVAFIIFMLLAFLRAQVCRCPQCGAWLFRQVNVDTDTHPRWFICKHCKVIWNSRVVLAIGGD